MGDERLKYTGERLVPGEDRLRQLLVEDLAKFHFANGCAMGRRVLDAGCGAGQGSAHMAQQGAKHVTGVDIATEAIAFASRQFGRADLAFAVMDVTRLGLQDGAFDFVTSIEVIEHSYNPEQYIAEIRRVLAIDGYLVLSTPNKLITSPRPGMMWPYHIHEFYPSELYDLLRKYFAHVEMQGLHIPVYEQHPLRKLVHRLAPLAKPILPRYVRTRFLPWLQARIKAELTFEDVVISPDNIEDKPTLIAVCRA
jgi:2-polyprenyl-3-methyl-5-hydroxy-6-metoxy-1,4-benzoquinol methylase